MLVSRSVEAFRRIRDKRWSTKDKLDQYRGILKLHGRETKLKAQDTAKFKRRISWQLCSYKKDVKKYRYIVQDVANRGILSAETRNLFQGRKDLLLKCREGEIEHISNTIYEENNRKRRLWDKLRYEKKNKMKQCFQLQMEHVELCTCVKTETAQQYVTKEQIAQQKLVARYQKSMAKQSAAKAINLTYIAMLDILRKDAIYHETFLNALSQDRRSQCQVIVRATIMGQLAVEQSDDIGNKCKLVARNVWNNMKERERTLAVVREQVDNLWSYAQSLIRTESETMFATGMNRAACTSNGIIDKQISSLEEACHQIKESLLVRSYREMLSRLEEQMKQRTRLLEQFDRNVKERDFLLGKKKDALSLLATLEYSAVAGVEEYNAEKSTLLEQIAMQKKRQVEYKDAKKSYGELLMDVRAALQTMIAMLVCVRKGGTKSTKKPDRKPAKPEKDEEQKPTEEQDEEGAPLMEKIETEGLALLSSVSRKVGALFGMSNFEFDQDREERARDLYQTYVSDYHSRLQFERAKSEPTGLVVEHEAIDSSVPTRAEIKLRSKQAVESYLKVE